MEPFIGEIIMFGGNFAPRGWALCDGQLLSISAYQSLFSILGTTYGGDGRTTFGLPGLRGRVAMHAGNGPGLSSRPLGQKSGTETVTLATSQIPAHKHNVGAIKTVGDSTSPTGNLLADSGSFDTEFRNATSDTTMKSDMIQNTGGGQSHNNIQPYQVINYIIALQGTYPSRN